MIDTVVSVKLPIGEMLRIKKKSSDAGCGDWRGEENLFGVWNLRR